jgi:hypothetical protein
VEDFPDALIDPMRPDSGGGIYCIHPLLFAVRGMGANAYACRAVVRS